MTRTYWIDLALATVGTGCLAYVIGGSDLRRYTAAVVGLSVALGLLFSMERQIRVLTLSESLPASVRVSQAASEVCEQDAGGYRVLGLAGGGFVYMDCEAGSAERLRAALREVTER